MEPVDSSDLDFIKVMTTLKTPILVWGSVYGLQDLGNGIQDDGSNRKFYSNDSAAIESQSSVNV